MNPARPSAGRPELPSSQLSTGEYLMLVALIAAGIVVCGLLINYGMTQRGLLAPANPTPLTPEHDGTNAPPA